MMKYIDEYQDKDLISNIAGKIADLGVSANLMEVCGTHTMAIFKFGIRSLLPKGVKLLSGPGCPVCVTSSADIDAMIKLSDINGAIITTFGDMVRVPGSSGSLNDKKALGSDVRVVYSPLDAIAIAKENGGRPVIFLGVGFETTAPTIAATIIEAHEKGINNFYVYSAHKLIPPAIRALLDADEVHIDGFLLPGHVSVIIGERPYEFIAKEFGIPAVIAGFEPVDIMESVYLLLKQRKGGAKAEVGVEYSRVVKAAGNPKAKSVLSEVFETAPAEWRGLGIIAHSGLEIKTKYSRFDAKIAFNIKPNYSSIRSSCSCGKILRGLMPPLDCKLFARTCTPEDPKGPCMVSTEGACAAYYKYGKR